MSIQLRGYRRPYDRWMAARAGDNVGSCCGSRYLPPDRPERAWANAHGRGVTPARVTDPIKENTKGILVVDGKVGEEITTKRDVVKHINTKNGVLTIAVRRVW